MRGWGWSKCVVQSAVRLQASGRPEAPPHFFTIASERFRLTRSSQSIDQASKQKGPRPACPWGTNLPGCLAPPPLRSAAAAPSVGFGKCGASVTRPWGTRECVWLLCEWGVDRSVEKIEARNQHRELGSTTMVVLVFSKCSTVFCVGRLCVHTRLAVVSIVHAIPKRRRAQAPARGAFAACHFTREAAPGEFDGSTPGLSGR